jgi:hypothetical protein
MKRLMGNLKYDVAEKIYPIVGIPRLHNHSGLDGQSWRRGEGVLFLKSRSCFLLEDRSGPLDEIKNREASSDNDKA